MTAADYVELLHYLQTPQPHLFRGVTGEPVMARATDDDAQEIWTPSRTEWPGSQAGALVPDATVRLALWLLDVVGRLLTPHSPQWGNAFLRFSRVCRLRLTAPDFVRNRLTQQHRAVLLGATLPLPGVVPGSPAEVEWKQRLLIEWNQPPRTRSSASAGSAYLPLTPAAKSEHAERTAWVQEFAAAYCALFTEGPQPPAMRADLYGSNTLRRTDPLYCGQAVRTHISSAIALADRANKSEWRKVAGQSLWRAFTATAAIVNASRHIVEEANAEEANAKHIAYLALCLWKVAIRTIPVSDAVVPHGKQCRTAYEWAEWAASTHTQS